ncbi:MULTISPECIES: MFS transporter [unclassified Arthrobacter]|uniref:MFS transporter n=1 Tax=unclassified Arthrobacter TaxID=235627 RepID=UPI000CE501CC|nr:MULTISPECIES: MFS transporter [unclassified Arthrobacter]
MRTSPPHHSGIPVSLLAPIALATSINGLNSSMISVGLVSIERDIGSGANITLLVTAFYLTCAVAQPIAGRLIDKVGPRSILLFGVTLVAVGSGLVYLITTVEALVGLRVVIGLGAATGYPAGMALLRRWAEVRGTTNSVSGVRTMIFSAQGTVMIAPAMGGILIEVWDWRAMFLINLPLCVLTAILILIGVPDLKASRQGTEIEVPKVDTLGFLLFAASLAPLLLAFTVFREGYWWVCLAVGVLSSIFFVRHQLQSPHPFIDFRLLGRDRNIGAPIVRQFVVMSVLYAVLFGFPTWLEGSRGLSPGDVGLIMLPLAGMGIVTTMFAGSAISKWGIRAPILIGAFLMVAATVSLFMLTADSSLAMVLVLAVLLGSPNGFFMLGNQVALYRASPTEHIGVTSGLLRTSQFVGGTVAMVLLSATFDGKSMDVGLHSLALVLGSLSLLIFVEACISRGLRPGT